MSSSYAATAAAGGAGWRPPFTASQWQELEHQALIFKYLVAGVPVPPELLVPILKSFESMAARFYHHPTMGYCSLYGKKLDPEPWRCRRTDGKKWRCSKNAYPDSKYCERHMHRGRNRSRKPVETTPTLSQSSQPPTSSPSSSSTVTTLAPSGGAGNTAAKSLPCSSGTGMIPLPSLGSGGGGDSAAQVSLTCRSGGLGQQLQIGPAGYYYQMAGGDNCSRYNNLLLDVKSEEVDEHNFLSEASAGSARGLGGAIEDSLDNPWQLMPSQLQQVSNSSYPLSTKTTRHVSDLHSGGGGSPPPPGRRPQSMQDFDREASSSLCAARQQQKQQHYCFFGSELDVGKAPPVKQQGQPLLSFFDEWPKYTRDSWSDLDQDDRSNRTSSLSTTQLSISMPVAASSDLSATSSRSPNGGGED